MADFCQISNTEQLLATILPALFFTFVLGVNLLMGIWRMNNTLRAVHMKINDKHVVTISTDEADGSVVVLLKKGASVSITSDDDDPEEDQEAEEEQPETTDEDEQEKEEVGESRCSCTCGYDGSFTAEDSRHNDKPKELL